jgi:hypothetical protein
VMFRNLVGLVLEDETLIICLLKYTAAYLRRS